MQFLDRRVLVPDLADLAAHADGDPVRLEGADERRQLGRAGVVLALLLVDPRPGEIDEGGRVDVDVPISSLERHAACSTDLLGHRLGIGGVLPGVELVMIALDEHRVPPACGDRSSEHGGGVVDRALVRVGLLAPRQLEDHGTDACGRSRVEDGPGHVEGLHPHVHRGNGETGYLASAASLVEILDARRPPPEGLARLPDKPLRCGGRGVVRRECRRPGEVADGSIAKRGIVVDDQPIVIEMGAAGEAGEQIARGSGDDGHRVSASLDKVGRSWYRAANLAAQELPGPSRRTAWSPSGAR